MRRNPLSVVLVLLVLAVAASQTLFTVHQTQRALVLQLGEPLQRVYGPGLHVKIPFIQNVVYFDARVLDYEARSREAFTVDKKAIVLDNYARWRIIDPLQFYRTMRSIPGAQARLDDVVYSQLRALVGAYTLTEVVSSHRAVIMKEVTNKVSALMHNYGVEVLDVRIKRTDLPTENQRAILAACGRNGNGRPSSTDRKARRNPQESVPTPTGSAPSSWRKPHVRRRWNAARAMPRPPPPTLRLIIRRPNSTPTSVGSLPCAHPLRITAEWC